MPIAAWPWRAVSSAASLTTFSSSAPVKPGQRRAISAGSTSSAHGRPWRYSDRICAPPLGVGRVDGDLAVEAARTQQRRVEDVRAVGRARGRSARAPASKPSISTSSWLSVCSRSSLPWPTPAPRLRPTASSSSMNTIAGAAARAWANRSRMRAAPTPTSDSTNSAPETEKNAACASPAVARASSVLPRAGRPDEQRALRRPRAERARSGRARGADRTAPRSSATARPAPGDIGEGGTARVAGTELGALARPAAERAHPARVGLLADAHEQGEERGEDQDRQQHLHDQALGLLAALRVDHDRRALRGGAW